MKEIDARDLSCPAPVLLIKEAIEQGGETILRVIVDNEAAKENVNRFMESKGFNVSINQKNDEYQITGRALKCEPLSMNGDQETTEQKNKILLMITSNRIGQGDQELGQKLMNAFLTTINELGDELWRLVFVNNGVKLTVKNSDVLDALQGLDNQGIKILVCGTCLSHFNLLEKKQVGETTNMLDIVTAMQIADKVINL